MQIRSVDTLSEAIRRCSGIQNAHVDIAASHIAHDVRELRVVELVTTVITVRTRYPE